MKNRAVRKIRSTLIGALVTMLFSNWSTGQTLEELEAKFAKAQQHCEELKKDEGKIKQRAQSSTLSPTQKKQAADAANTLDGVIRATEAMLKDPALKTNPEKQKAAFAKAQSEIVYGNALASVTEKELGIPRSGITDHVIAASVNIDGLLTQRARFDGSPAASWANGDGGFKGSGVGNAFFHLGANNSTPVAVHTSYAPTTPEYAERNKKVYGSSGGGILLEDSAEGLTRISAVKYDGRYNALLMDDHFVYLMKVPSWDAAALCRAIARDDEKMRVGVSMGSTILVYGDRSSYENTAVAEDLLLTDHFLGDFVFGRQDWTKGYKFPNGYEPKATTVESHMLVQFVFRGFQFMPKDNEIQLTDLALDVRFMPVSKEPAPDGGMLADVAELNRGWKPPPEYDQNAEYLKLYFNDFFRKERIVAKTIAYGELAALFRSYRRAGVNLEALASDLERG